MEEAVLVITFIDAERTKRILDENFDRAPGGTITFHNKYFNISVNLRIVSNLEADKALRDDIGKVDMAKFPAIVLLSSSEPSTISRCQKWWDSMNSTVCADTVKVLFLEGDNFQEKQTYEILAWGLRMGIEVVNSFLCKEDDIEIPARLQRILECSPWPSVSSHDEDRESKKDDAARDKIQEASHDDFNLSKPTSLRRGLHERDLLRLVNDLVLVDDSDSDG